MGNVFTAPGEERKVLNKDIERHIDTVVGFLAWSFYYIIFLIAEYESMKRYIGGLRILKKLLNSHQGE